MQAYLCHIFFKTWSCVKINHVWSYSRNLLLYLKIRNNFIEKNRLCIKILRHCFKLSTSSSDCKKKYLHYLAKFKYMNVQLNFAQWVRSLDLTTHTRLSPIRRGFAPGFVNYKKGALDSQPQVIKLTSCLPMVGGSLRVLRLPPPLKLIAMILLKYCWKWR